MMRFLWLMLICVLFAVPALAQEDVLTLTEEWQPPVITEACIEDEPWLLVLKIAQEEIGYVEGPLSNQTKYGEWFSGGRPAWCAEFLTWCVNEADTRYGTNLLRTVYPYYGKSSEGLPWFIERARFVSRTGRIPNSFEKQWIIGSDTYMETNEYIPSPGDYIWFFTYTYQRGPDHVGIVEGVSRDADGAIQVHVIEGNNPDRVQRKIYPLTHEFIYGYGTPVQRVYTNVGLYDRSDDVYLLEEILVAQGCMEPRKGSPNEMEKELRAGLKKYQRAHGLEATGVWDLATRNYMEQNGHTITQE